MFISNPVPSNNSFVFFLNYHRKIIFHLIVVLNIILEVPLFFKWHKYSLTNINNCLFFYVFYIVLSYNENNLLLSNFLGFLGYTSEYKPDIIHLSSIHFGENYIHLNNNPPNDPIFDSVWSDCEKACEAGVKIVLMIGGAGSAYNQLFSDYNKYYALLKETLLVIL